MFENISRFDCLTLISLTLSACTPQSADIKAPKLETTSAGQPLIMGETYTLSSTILNMDRRITIRLPEGWMGYNDGEARNYPVVYVIDGGPDQDFPHLAGLSQSREINDTFSPFILVGIETVNRRYQITPPVSDIDTYEAEMRAKPGGSSDFRSFIREELKPWIEAKYRTSGRNAVIGESLGGLFIIETLMEDPNLFDDYIAINPSLWWNNMTYGIEADRRLPSILENKRLYLTSAEEGYLHEAGIKALVETLEQKTSTGLLWSYYALAGQETHASAYHGTALDAFRALFPQTVQFGRAGPLLSGQPRLPRSEEDQKLIDAPCTIETAKRTSLQETYKDPAKFAYHCMLQDYGQPPTAGNMPLPFTE